MSRVQLCFFDKTLLTNPYTIKAKATYIENQTIWFLFPWIRQTNYFLNLLGLAPATLLKNFEKAERELKTRISDSIY